MALYLVFLFIREVLTFGEVAFLLKVLALGFRCIPGLQLLVNVGLAREGSTGR